MAKIAMGNMNGLITVPTSRSTFRNQLTPRQVITSVALGMCLFTGFLAGFNIPSQLVQKLVGLNPLHEETIDYSKINWIQNGLASKKVQFTSQNAVETTQIAAEPDSIEFVPYVLDPQPAKLPAKKIRATKRKGAMLRELQLAYDRFEKVMKENAEPSQATFFEFQVAAKKLRQDFISVTDPSAKPSVMMAEVSVPAIPSKEEKVESIPMTQSSAVTVDMNRWKPAPRRPQPKEPIAAHAAIAVPTETKKPVEEKVQTKEPVVAEVTDVSYPEATPAIQEPKKMDTQVMSIQNKTDSTQVKQTYSSSELSKEEKDKLSEMLLSAQLENSKIAKVQNVRSVKRVPANQDVVQTTQQTPITPEPETERTPVPTEEVARHASTGCRTLDHPFVKPNGQTDGGVDNQICPEHKTWISKDWNEKGWVKVESADVIPTLTYHPAANNGSTLLLDSNGLAALSIKAGVRIAKGTGLIIGLVPQGYKVEFLGRGEETQYFDLNQKKYFAILNAEPGSGILELVSQHNQNLSSTVFTPVLEDTVTYMDLAAPKSGNIGVQVVKNAQANDAEVAGLTVGISTQGNIQAITQSNGAAVLKNVSLVPGYPVFIDVASKTKDQQSYTYRYQLKQQNKLGYFVVNQIAEKSLYRWLRQVKQGLSDQSAMVVGFYNRKVLDGFKNEYHTRTEPKGARFGLDPLNYSILWDGKISSTEPLEGDVPRFMSVQVPEGLSQVQLVNESNQIVNSQLIPVSPRIIHVISE